MNEVLTHCSAVLRSNEDCRSAAVCKLRVAKPSDRELFEPDRGREGSETPRSVVYSVLVLAQVPGTPHSSCLRYLNSNSWRLS